MPTNKFTITEEELGRRMLCSWMPPTELHPTYTPSFETLKWAMKERYDGSIPTMAEIRTRYVFQWHKIWGDRPRDGQEYWDGIRHAAGLAEKIRGFILRYSTDPIHNYSLELPSGIITGKAALVRRTVYRSDPKIDVLDVVDYRPKFYLMPNAVALARWLAMRQEYDGVGLGLVHFPLRVGLAWHEEHVNELLAKSWLNGILKEAMTGGSYPRPGSHCRDCPAPCKEVFRG